MRSILFHDSIEQASSGALMVSHGLRIPVNPAQAGSFALLRPYRVSGKARHVKGEFLFARSGQKGGEIEMPYRICVTVHSRKSWKLGLDWL